ELRAVVRALDRGLTDVDVASIQVGMSVRAHRTDGPEALLTEVGHGDLSPVDGEPPRLAGRDVAGAADTDERHHDSGSSSASIERSTLVRTSPRSIRSKTSLKNPNTISRSASSRGIPRLIT